MVIKCLKRQYDEVGGYTTPLAENKRLKTILATHATNRRWSIEEDAVLTTAVENNGTRNARNWKGVAEMLPGRSHAQCQQRWSRVLKPGIKKGRWTTAEDSHLHRLVTRGWMNWTVVANEISGRTPKQCRERWYHYLDPSVNRGPYSEEEDALILAQHDRLGGRWARIAQMLKGRTSEAVRNRFRTLDRWHKSGSIDRCPQFPCQRSIQFSPAPPHEPEANHHSYSNDSLFSSVPRELQPLTPPTSFPWLGFAAHPSVVAKPNPEHTAAPITPSFSSLSLGKSSKGRTHTLTTHMSCFRSCCSFSSLLSSPSPKAAMHASSHQPGDWVDEVDQVLQNFVSLQHMDEGPVFLQHMDEDLDLVFLSDLDLVGDHRP